MQIGVVYPQNELSGNPAAVRRIGGLSRTLALTT